MTIKVERGSGNVFADLELLDSDEMLAKSDLAIEIHNITRKHGVTLDELTLMLNVGWYEIQEILAGRHLRDVPIERLRTFLSVLKERYHD